MKKIIFFILFFVTLFSLIACGKNQIQGDEGMIGMSRRGMPDFGQPEEAPDVMGIVKSIVGNEIAIFKIERPERGLKNKLDNNESKKNKESNRSLSFESGIGAGAGKMPGMGRFGGIRGDGDDMTEMIKKMSTGEETIIIPVGIQMLKTEASDAGAPTVLEANLNDIESDKMVTIWLNKDIFDKNVASFVLIK